MTQQTIITKYLAPTKTLDPRIKAKQSYGKTQVTIPWDYSLDVEGNHLNVAQTLLNKLAWRGKWKMGSLEYGYVFVNANEINTPAIVATNEVT